MLAGRIDATTDGLLMTRFMLGIRGAALVNAALVARASRTLPACPRRGQAKNTNRLVLMCALFNIRHYGKPLMG